MAAPDLPLQLTSFVGRQRELADVRRLLSAGRLVTVTGPGGSGKTRLALAAAERSEDAQFVSLAAIDDPTFVIPTIAQALGVAETPDRLHLDLLKEFLRERPMLLLLDNFEQVISAAPLLIELLGAAEGLKLLVTSREALRLRGEQEYPLAPLELFSGELTSDAPDLDRLLNTPSIALFVERARGVQPNFQLADENAAAVAEICARLDGLPLAIELAAARVKLLPPEALLGRLQEAPLQLLTGGPRDAPPRQQTLRAAVRWSYDLLPPEEQRLFRVLSVFVGGCTLDALSAVSEGPSTAVLEHVASLVDKSLVIQSESDGQPRLTMLETIREFGLEMLTRSSESHTRRQAHASHFLSLAEEASPQLTGSGHKAWLNRLQREQDNFRAALRWGFEGGDSGRADFLLRMTGALWEYWFLRGQWSEGRRWLEETLSATAGVNVDEAIKARALFGGAMLTHYQGDSARARALCEGSVAIYRAIGDREGLLAALLHLCRVKDYLGDDESMASLIADGLAIADGLPDGPIKAQAYAELAFTGLSYGHASEQALRRADRYLAKSERIYRALENRVGLANSLVLHGLLAGIRGDEARSETLQKEAERLSDEVDDRRLKMRVNARGMSMAWKRGDDPAARQYFKRLLEMRVKAAESPALLEQLAAILHRQGLSTWAARVYGRIDELEKNAESQPRGRRIIEQDRERLKPVRAEVRAHLGEAAFARSLAEGRGLTAEDLLAIPHPAAPGAPAPVLPALESLTPRETEVLALLAEGLSNPQIAERLVVSRRTVDAHLQHVYDKLGVHSRDAAVRAAQDLGLIERR